MEFRRLEDLKLVRAILTWKGVYDAIGDDYIPPVDGFEVNQHPDIWYLGAHSARGLIGMFTLMPASRVCWEVHVVMLPWATTKEKWEAARALPVFLRENTECRRLTAAVPHCNWPAIVYGTHGIGMHYVGCQSAAFMKNGRLQDLVVLGLSIGS